MRPISERGNFGHPSRLYGESVLGAGLEYWPSEADTDLLFVAGIHGEEPDTSVLLSRALRSIPSPSRSVAAVVAANPDGIARGTRCNARGVDLNRNFPTADWQAEPITYRWSSRHESEVQLGTGECPGSEPETDALVKLVGQLHPRFIVALHGHLSCVDDPLASPLGKWIAQRTALPLVDGVGYSTPGSMGTWAAEKGIPIVTWELGPESIESMYHSQLPVLIDILRGNYDS